ncbi:helix-turn-helix domain-containing protein [Amnibacterium sp.]|uniref:helix-turn-helix domain-containing protein n=1 Tax=Amnibacterium sp. TaxID=1872496 RepID=UPI0026047A4F|nr:XRE family transcriptional regulator [Amnibacterium sp.]
MDTDTAALASAIGARIRRERQARGLTLDRLAELAQVSRRMVVNVEQGGVNPSVGTLLRLADALGVGLPALVETVRPAPMAVVRSGEGAVLWTGEHGGRGVLLAGTEPPEVVELWQWTMATGERHQSEAHAAGTQELLQVLEGRLVLEVGGETVELTPGDAVRFRGDVAHAYAADALTRFVLAVFEPGVGARTGRTGA